MPENETAMDAQDMKRLLLRSRQEPVSCAFAEDAETHAGLILFDRIKQPKVVAKELLKQCPEAKSLRYGTASVDTKDSPKLVKFAVNKPASGMVAKLVKSLKGTGFNKVEITRGVAEDE